MSADFEAFASRGLEAFVDAFEARGRVPAVIDRAITGDQFRASILSSSFTQTWTGSAETPVVIGVTGLIVDKGLEGFFLHCFQRRGQGNDGSAAFADEGFNNFGLLDLNLSDPALDLTDIITAGEETTSSVGQTVRIQGKNTVGVGAQRIVAVTVAGDSLSLEAEYFLSIAFDSSDDGVLPDINGLFLTPNPTVGNHATLNQLFAIFNFDTPATQDDPAGDPFPSTIVGSVKMKFEILT